MTDWPNIATGVVPAEREWLKQQAEDLAGMGPEAVIVHIGVDGGMSLHCSRRGAPEATIVGIDLEMGGFQNTIGAELIQGNSHIVHHDWERPIHFLFVDGDHSRPAVTADMLGWLPLVVPGGIVAFHDYGNKNFRWCLGVSEAVDEWDWTGWQEIPAAGSIKAYQKPDPEKESKRGRTAKSKNR